MRKFGKIFYSRASHKGQYTLSLNNQAEQFAILIALENIETLNNNIINPRTTIIYTDSRVSLDSLLNPKNHAFLVEKIRRKVANIQNNDWKINFLWVKAQCRKLEMRQRIN